MSRWTSSCTTRTPGNAASFDQSAFTFELTYDFTSLDYFLVVTSAEVIQELLHAYLPAGRAAALDAALTLTRSLVESWPVEPAEVYHARSLHNCLGLGARDLLHLACCRRRGVTRI
ncbi:PIN domain-containing protein [Candidatus Mycobacterium methanotrophicum]|uniref:PIN domain-containing protein n=1 Tax=Candidatus Mycobacterium methanotrophicum TaxID=2943498 RepID=A0ABY4QK99_9MYCO|nr:PIN domain-containing protein [Candidatus Mycobacterium methanotrophicum]UQX10266.1 PIN domain-containing protein [Candidatus Mycobacterium methanotrophicum]